MAGRCAYSVWGVLSTPDPQAPDPVTPREILPLVEVTSPLVLWVIPTMNICWNCALAPVFFRTWKNMETCWGLIKTWKNNEKQITKNWAKRIWEVRQIHHKLIFLCETRLSRLSRSDLSFSCTENDMRIFVCVTENLRNRTRVDWGAQQGMCSQTRQNPSGRRHGTETLWHLAKWKPLWHSGSIHVRWLLFVHFFNRFQRCSPWHLQTIQSCCFPLLWLAVSFKEYIHPPILSPARNGLQDLLLGIISFQGWPSISELFWASSM